MLELDLVVKNLAGLAINWLGNLFSSVAAFAVVDEAVGGFLVQFDDTGAAVEDSAVGAFFDWHSGDSFAFLAGE